MKTIYLLLPLLFFSVTYSQISFLDFKANDVGCIGANDGSVVFEISGGLPPFTCSISPDVGFNGSTGNFGSFNALPPGTYSIEVLDFLGSLIDTTISITELGHLNVQLEIMPDTCLTGDGEIHAVFPGGLAPFSVSLNTIPLISNNHWVLWVNADAGVYDLSITDALGCSYVNNNVMIDTIYNTQVNGGPTNYTSEAWASFCYDGAAQVIPTGNTTPYSISWDSPINSNLFYVDQLHPGTYHFSITDSIGCFRTDSIVILDSLSSGTCGLIQGNVFADNNGNCINDSEPGSGIMVRAQPGGYFTYADPVTGNYSLYVPSGVYDVYCDSSNSITNLCTPIYNVNAIIGGPIIQDIDFGNIYSLDMAAESINGLMRSNISSTVSFIFGGQLVASENFDAYVVIDPEFNVSGSDPVYDYQNGDTLFWNNLLFDFSPNSVDTNYVINVTGTTGLFVGDSLSFCSRITSINPDLDPINDLMCRNNLVIGPYDPNDKHVSPAGPIFLTNETLEYTVRFQNTGTDTAINVVVIDTLSDLLDPSTFEFVYATHNCVPEINNNILQFNFNNINLPDSNVDESGSNGKVIFRMNQASSNSVGDTILNKVEIYFDFNPPIVTNYAMSPIIDPSQVGLNENYKSNFSIYPNPAKDNFTIDLNATKTGQVQISDASGRLLYNKEFRGKNKLSINSSNWQKGIYLIQVIAESQVSTSKIVIE